MASSVAWAQVSARVLRDQTPIWHTGFLTIAAIVSAGTELEVVAGDNNWLEIRLPSGTQGTTSARTGFIARNQVELSGGTVPPRQSGPAANAPRRDGPQRSAARPAAPGAPGLGFSGFGQVSYGRFAARQSFTAVLGQEDGVWFGAGGQFRSRTGIFGSVSVDRFRRTGERVFVSDAGEVFQLGISETLTLTPVTATAGYYFLQKAVTAYAGGGIGRYFLSEISAIASEDENFKDQFTSYHAVVGFEWVTSPHFGTAVELQYTRVPKSLTGNVATAFGEDDLGGIQARFRFLFR